jgi:hypothetical protein
MLHNLTKPLTHSFSSPRILFFPQFLSVSRLDDDILTYLYKYIVPGPSQVKGKGCGNFRLRVAASSSLVFGIAVVCFAPLAILTKDRQTEHDILPNPTLNFVFHGL